MIPNVRASRNAPKTGREDKEKPTLSAVSLFSNCGAGDLGFAKAGFRFTVLAEIDRRRLDVALLNHCDTQGVVGDLRETWPDVVKTYQGSATSEVLTLLSACPPCQGMSSASGRRGSENDPVAGSRDKRNLLVEVVAEVTNVLDPRILVVENVRAFLSKLVLHPKDNRPVSAAALLIELVQEKYEVFPFLTDLADYGVPQRRIRAFLTFIRRGDVMVETLRNAEKVPYPASCYDGEEYAVTLAQALKDLGAQTLDARSESEAREEGQPMHSVPVWGDGHQYQMVAAIPPGSGGRAWQNSCCNQCGDVSVGTDDATCPECGGPLLRPVVQEADGSYRLVKGFRSSSYSRMSPNTPAATITTASGHVGSDLTIHPYENRVLSPLECAYLQTFPEDFEWGTALEKWGSTLVRTMIGEAVPPRFTELHGQALINLMAGSVMNLAGQDDPRVGKAEERLAHRGNGREPSA